MADCVDELAARRADRATRIQDVVREHKRAALQTHLHAATIEDLARPTADVTPCGCGGVWIDDDGARVHVRVDVDDAADPDTFVITTTSSSHILIADVDGIITDESKG